MEHTPCGSKGNNLGQYDRPLLLKTVEKAIFKGLTASSKDTLLSFGKIKGLSICYSPVMKGSSLYQY